MNPSRLVRTMGLLALSAALSCGPADEGESAESGRATIEHATAEVNGLRLHYAEAGEGELVLFLHGFPEFWYAWRHQLTALSTTHRAVAVDMRGYNLSSKPTEVEAYAMPLLVADVRQLAAVLTDRPFTLVGHDWGGFVAWTFAMSHPELLRGLVIINAPHPAIFQRELRENAAQQQASQYMLAFRSSEAEEMLSANDYAALEEAVLSEGLRTGYLDEEDRIAYREAWSQPGALTGGLNYYRAAASGPSVAGEGTGEGEPAEGAPAAGEATGPAGEPQEVRIPRIDVPTLVIWGERDPYLLPGNLDGLDQYVSRLTVRRVPDAGHWIVQELPNLVNDELRAFLERDR